MNYNFLVSLLFFIGLFIIFIIIVIKKDLQYWLPSYVLQKIKNTIKKKNDSLKHIIICKVDHFEPGTNNVSKTQQEKRVRHWSKQYPIMAKRHKDSDGFHPKHTWFYPPHHQLRFLNDLVKMCEKGFGEIEFHLHHNRMDPFPDTEKTLREKIVKAIKKYGEHGIFRTVDGKTCFAFIHGDWSLDNSLGPNVCGIDNEINILLELGCYADFTFPSLGKAQPSRINSIYYSKANPFKPKSYNWGKRLVCNRKNNSLTKNCLLMIQGIIGFRWKSRTHRFKPSIEASNIDSADAPFPSRIDYWIKNAVTIPGKSNWKFIKLHTHGAREETWDALTGSGADRMFSYLEENYNDGKNYVLHYVSAREMYNIAKAAEDGLNGKPGEYRNYKIKEYIYLNKERKESHPNNIKISSD